MRVEHKRLRVVTNKRLRNPDAISRGCMPGAVNVGSGLAVRDKRRRRVSHTCGDQGGLEEEEEAAGESADEESDWGSGSYSVYEGPTTKEVSWGLGLWSRG